MAFDFPTAPAVGAEYTSGGVTYQFNGTGWIVIGAASSVADVMGPPQGRLTLSNMTPVMILSVAAAPTIFYTAYHGDEVPIYDGVGWSMVALPGGQLSAALNDVTHSPAPIGVSKVNDWFVFLDAGGVLRLCHGPDWTDDLTRSAGTGLNFINGIWLNFNNITNGPNAARGTYVGTTRSNATSTIDWIYGTLALNGGPSAHMVWNTYNRVDVASMVGDSAASAALSAMSMIPYPANMRHNFVSGLAEDVFEFFNLICGTGSAAGNLSLAVGYDITVAPHAIRGNTGYITPNYTVNSVASFRTPALGAHFACCLAGLPYGGTGYVYGNSGLPSMTQSGFWFKGKM